MKKEDIKIAICNNSCHCELMRGGSKKKNFYTTKLISHMKFHHPEIYKDYQTKVTAKQTAAALTNKPVQQTLDITMILDKSSAKAKEITCSYENDFS